MATLHKGDNDSNNFCRVNNVIKIRVSLFEFLRCKFRYAYVTVVGAVTFNVTEWLVMTLGITVRISRRFERNLLYISSYLRKE